MVLLGTGSPGSRLAPIATVNLRPRLVLTAGFALSRRTGALDLGTTNVGSGGKVHTGPIRSG